MAPRLKVFSTSNGLTLSAVAVSSKAKALEAFGTKQDLFKEGLAAEATDPALVEAALARPGEVVTRSALAAGALEAALAATPKAKKKGKAETAKAGTPPALVARVKRLEERLAELESRRKAEKADFAERRAELERLEGEAKAAFKKKRKEVEAELETARAAVRAEGG